MGSIGKVKRSVGRRGVGKIIFSAIFAAIALCAAAVALALNAGGGH